MLKNKGFVGVKRAAEILDVAPNRDDSMTPRDAKKKQIELYRQMTGEERLLVGLRLHETACEIARSGIRAAHPEANEQQVQERLKQRIQLAYRDHRREHAES